MKLMDLANRAEGGEVEHSETSVPRGILLALIINCTLAHGWIIALLFNIDNLKATLESPTGYPIMEIFYQATGSICSANGMICPIIIVAFFLHSLASSIHVTYNVGF